MNNKIICKDCNTIGNGYCSQHSTSGIAYLEKGVQTYKQIVEQAKKDFEKIGFTIKEENDFLESFASSIHSRDIQRFKEMIGEQEEVPLHINTMEYPEETYSAIKKQGKNELRIQLLQQVEEEK